MAIDKSGQLWVGSEPRDIEEFLVTMNQVDSYPVHEFRLASCTCSSLIFKIDFDEEEGGAQRTCTSCGVAVLICDSEEYWSECEPEPWECVNCGSGECNVGVGFSLYDDLGDIRWLYVGARCAQCGALHFVVDWKVGYGPSLQLIDAV